MIIELKSLNKETITIKVKKKKYQNDLAIYLVNFGLKLIFSNKLDII